MSIAPYKEDRESYINIIKNLFSQCGNNSVIAHLDSQKSNNGTRRIARYLTRVSKKGDIQLIAGFAQKLIGEVELQGQIELLKEQNDRLESFSCYFCPYF